MRMRHTAALALALLTVGASAAAEPRILGICQTVIGDEATCEAATAWSLDKATTTPALHAPDGDRAAFTVTVTEGETRHTLRLAAALTLTGLMPEGTHVRGLVVSLQRGDDAGAYATVASAGFGDTSETCGCPFVDSGELSVALVTLQGAPIAGVEGSVVELLAYGEDVRVDVEATYDLAAGLVRPGDDVRLSTCVVFTPADELGALGCVGAGGGLRTVKACSAFDVAAYGTPDPLPVTLIETFGAPGEAFVSVSSATALPNGDDVGHITPAGPMSLSPGGPAASWQMTPTGVPGHVTTFSIEAPVRCADDVACEAPDGPLCRTSIDNRVALILPGEGAPLEAAATVAVACPRTRCDSGEEAACDDGDPCTDDACDPAGGCVYTHARHGCDDGDPCTSGDFCAAGACVPGGLVACADDGDPCTAAACDQGAGCVAVPLDGPPCDDGDACTVGDTCAAGTCHPGDALACGIGDACTTGATCVDGACRGGAPVVCDDGNSCTDDACDPALGCVVTPRDGPCDDGSACTDGDACAGGVCVPGPPLACASGQPCRGAYCDPTAGCVVAPTGDGEWCDDGDACTGCPWPELGVARGFDVTRAAVVPGTLLPDGYVLWFAGFDGPPEQTRMVERDGLDFLVFGDGSAVVRGVVERIDADGAPMGPEHRWALELALVYRGEGPAGQGTGGPHRELPEPYQGFESSDTWRYFDLASGMMQRLSGGAHVELTVRPAPGVFPFQMGWQANGRNTAFGMSGWFTFVHHTDAGGIVSGPGDLNVDLREVFCGDNDVCQAGVCQAGEEVAACAGLGPGDYCSYVPADFAAPCVGSADNGGCVLEAAFKDLLGPFPACWGEVTFAVGFTTWRRYAFRRIESLRAFLAAGDMSGPAVGRGELLCDPHPIYSDAFIRELIALDINIRLSDGGFTPAPSGHPLGDLEVDGGECGGYTVREVAHRAEMVFAGLSPASGPCAGQALVKSVRAANRAFRSCGTASGFLVLGAPYTGDALGQASRVIHVPMEPPD